MLPTARQEIDRALSLIGQGDLARAHEVLVAVSTRFPDDPEVLYLAGSTALALGDTSAARDALERSLAIDAGMPEALHDLGLVELEAGEIQRAMKLLSAAVEGRPDHPGMHHSLALALDRVGDAGAAIDGYRRCLELAPDLVAARVNLATVLTREGELSAAEDALNAVLAADPGHAEALHNLGYLLRAASRLDEAEAVLGKALERIPMSAETLNLLSLVLSDQGRYDEAEQACRRALEADPGSVVARNNLALSLIAQGRCMDAVPLLGEALERAPNDPVSHHNLSYLAFCLGDQATGWREYEWSFAAGVRTPDRQFAVPRWTGPGDARARVLAWREQGIGDEIMFAGCFPDLLRSVEKVVIECDARLVELFARSFPDADVFEEQAAPLDVFDAHVPHGSLGGYYRKTAEDYPDERYLSCDPAKLRKWRERLVAAGERPKIGISWTSGLLNNDRRLWFSELEQWEPVLRRSDVDLVSLQYGDHEEELCAVEAKYGCRVLRWADIDLMNDIDDLAALSACLTGAVGASGAAMTLAAAVGTPIVQVRKDPEPVFYACYLPTCSIVRKPWTRSWSDAIAAVNREIDVLLNS